MPFSQRQYDIYAEVFIIKKRNVPEAVN